MSTLTEQPERCAMPAGHGDEMAYLRELTHQGAERRYGLRGSETEKACGVIEHELAVIEQLGYPGYFLVVWELVEYCRREGILCQGRGSAANSAVCVVAEAVLPGRVSCCAAQRAADGLLHPANPRP
jgi:DNA polymerase III alpha subunit